MQSPQRAACLVCLWMRQRCLAHAKASPHGTGPIRMVKRLEASERVPSSGGLRLLMILMRTSLGRSSRRIDLEDVSAILTLQQQLTVYEL